MYSIAVTEPGKVEIVQIPKPDPGPYEVRIKTEAACLCNATDRKLVEGHFPGVEKYPLLLGHETAGIVDAVGKKVRHFSEGDRVIGGLLLRPTDPSFASGWGGFSEYVIAGDHRSMVADGVADSDHGWYEVYEVMRVVLKEIPVEAAVLLCTWREVYAAFGDFNLQPGHNILVFGAGPVGLSFVKFARLMGLGFIGVVDYSEEKRTKAVELGATDTFASDEQAFTEWVRKLGKPFDAIIDAVGQEAIINLALPMLKMGGSACVYGVIDQPEIKIQKKTAPYNFNLLVHQWPTRWREAAAQEPLCAWLAQGKLSASDFLSAEFPIMEINHALDFSRTGKTLKILLRF